MDEEEMMPPDAAGMGAPEQFQPMDAPQQGADPELLETAKAIAQDPEFAQVMQWCRENAPDFATGITNALMTIVPGFQQKYQLDDDTMLGPVLVTMVVAALEVASEGGDDEATPEQIDAIRDGVIDRMGRMDAQMEADEADAAEQQMQQPQAPANRLSAMMGA